MAMDTHLWISATSALSDRQEALVRACWARSRTGRLRWPGRCLERDATDAQLDEITDRPRPIHHSTAIDVWAGPHRGTPAKLCYCAVQCTWRYMELGAARYD